jgi:hypothetical protein
MRNELARCLPGKFILRKTGGADENNKSATKKDLALNGVCLFWGFLFRDFLRHEKKK